MVLVVLVVVERLVGFVDLTNSLLVGSQPLRVDSVVTLLGRLVTSLAGRLAHRVLSDTPSHTLNTEMGEGITWVESGTIHCRSILPS